MAAATCSWCAVAVHLRPALNNQRTHCAALLALQVAAAALRRGAALRAPAGAADAAQLLLGDGAPEALLCSASSSSKHADASFGDACRHAVEICLAPQEEDPQGGAKAALLGALGLGGAHYLTPAPPPSPVRRR
jgi:hypothetical protein